MLLEIERDVAPGDLPVGEDEIARVASVNRISPLRPARCGNVLRRKKLQRGTSNPRVTEEKNADRLLTQLAEADVNQRAEAA